MSTTLRSKLKHNIYIYTFTNDRKVVDIRVNQRVLGFVESFERNLSMTLQEISRKYNFSETTIQKSFTKTQDSIYKKYGVKIIKEGRGKAVNYIEIVDTQLPNLRAKSMFQEDLKHEIFMDTNNLKMITWDFMVFLGIITTPMYVFRGSYIDFLKYVETSNSGKALNALKDSLQRLAEQKYILYTVDPTNENYFVAALCKQTEEDMKIDIEMIGNCKYLAQKNNMKSWVPLLKTWLSINLFSIYEYYTSADVEIMTGLSAGMVRKCSNILISSNIIHNTKVYAKFNKCLGRETTMTHPAFYQL